MIISTSIAQILPGQDAMPDYVENLHRKMRRMRWFDYVRRRFGMVAFDDVADWCAREPASLDRDEGCRTKAYQELLAAIRQGEFGAGEWPAIAHMPRNVPTYRPYCLRLSCGQIAILSADSNWGLGLAADLWAPSQLVAQWFKRRGIELPPWLVDAEAELNEVLEPPPPDPKAHEPPSLVVAESPKPPFDTNQAHAILVGMKAGMKVKGHIMRRPSREEAQDLLMPHFAKVPRDPVGKIVTEVWGPGKTGPRDSRAAKSAKSVRAKQGKS
jgi:hypothetical protein